LNIVWYLVKRVQDYLIADIFDEDCWVEGVKWWEGFDFIIFENAI
jgi:hypothetical protein